MWGMFDTSRRFLRKTIERSTRQENCQQQHAFRRYINVCVLILLAENTDPKMLIDRFIHPPIHMA